MGHLLVRRALQAVVLVAITLTLTFVLLHVAPGDPLARYVDPGVDPADMERIRHSLGLDQPLHVRFVQWAKAFVTGDFGTRDRKSTRLNSSHTIQSRMPSSA